jgi:hypothetical protein
MASALLGNSGSTTVSEEEPLTGEATSLTTRATTTGPTAVASNDAEQVTTRDGGPEIAPAAPSQASSSTKPARVVAEEGNSEDETGRRVPPQAAPVREAVDAAPREADGSDDDAEDRGWISPTITSGRRRVEEPDVSDEDFSEVTFQTSLYFAGTDIPKAKKLAKLDETTHAGVVMDAVDAAIEADVLRDLVAAKRTTSRPEASLFPSRRAMRPRAAQAGPRGSLFPVQMTQAECDVLDDLVGELGAASRSALVSAAMTWYLRTPRVVRLLARKGR